MQLRYDYDTHISQSFYKNNLIFLFGAHLNARYAVVKNLELMLGAYTFSLYKSEGTYEQLHDKSKALQLQLGLSYNFASIFCKAK